MSDDQTLTTTKSQPDLEVKQPEVAEKKEQDPLDAYAQFFYLYSPRLRATMNLMSKKQLIRLMFGLVQYPLNDKDLKLREKIEQDAFHIGDELLKAKYFMIVRTFLDEAEKQLAKQGETVVQSENKVEETPNGQD